jgi:hypothetical protein
VDDLNKMTKRHIAEIGELGDKRRQERRTREIGLRSSFPESPQAGSTQIVGGSKLPLDGSASGRVIYHPEYPALMFILVHTAENQAIVGLQWLAHVIPFSIAVETIPRDWWRVSNGEWQAPLEMRRIALSSVEYRWLGLGTLAPPSTMPSSAYPWRYWGA